MHLHRHIYVRTCAYVKKYKARTRIAAHANPVTPETPCSGTYFELLGDGSLQIMRLLLVKAGHFHEVWLVRDGGAETRISRGS